MEAKTTAVKQAEATGYTRGYHAGRRRRKVDDSNQARQRERQAFLDKAFLAALPALINGTDWTMGGKPVTTMNERVELAWCAARAALNRRQVA